MTQVQEKSISTLVLEEVNTLMKDIKNKKVNETATGVSFFEGNRRFCKLLNSKKKANLELNVLLPKDLQAIDGMTTYSTVEASKKHLGTMRHLFQTDNIESLKKVINAAFLIFVADGKKKAEELKTQEAKKATDNAAKAAKTTGTTEKKIIVPGTPAATTKASGVSTRQLTSEDVEHLQKLQAQGKYKPLSPKNTNTKPVEPNANLIMVPNGVAPGPKEIITNPAGDVKVV